MVRSSRGEELNHLDLLTDPRAESSDFTEPFSVLDPGGGTSIPSEQQGFAMSEPESGDTGFRRKPGTVDQVSSPTQVGVRLRFWSSGPVLLVVEHLDTEALGFTFQPCWVVVALPRTGTAGLQVQLLYLGTSRCR